MSVNSFVAPKSFVLVAKSVWTEPHLSPQDTHRFVTDSRNYTLTERSINNAPPHVRECVNPECRKLLDDDTSYMQRICLPSDRGDVVAVLTVACRSRPECCTMAKQIVQSKISGMLGSDTKQLEICSSCQKLCPEDQCEKCPRCKAVSYCSERCRFMHILSHRADCERILAEKRQGSKK